MVSGPHYSIGEADMHRAVKLFQRGVLTWDEAHNLLATDGISESEILSLIGTKAASAAALAEALQ